MGISIHPGESQNNSGTTGKAFANAAAVFLVAVAAFFTTCALTRLFPSGELTDFAVTIRSEAGGTRLEDKDVADIRIFYSTEDDPIFSDRPELTKDEILSSEPAIVDRKHIVQLPNDITGVRVDFVLANTADLNDGVFPEVKL